MFFTRTTMVLGLSVVTMLAGCAGQGNHTSKGSLKSQERLAQVKSGVEYQTAERQFMAGDLEKALRTIERSISINPAVSKSHTLRGRVYLEMASYDEARECLMMALELDPASVQAHYFLGIIDERTSRFAEALERYTRAMQLEPGDAQYVVAASEMYVQLGQGEKAEALLRESMGRFPTTAALRHTLGQLSAMRGDDAAALEWFNQARLLAPEDQVILEDLTRTLVALDQYGQAETNLNEMLREKANAGRVDLQMLHIRCLAALDRLGEARTALGLLLDKPEHKSDVQGWIMMGNLAARMNDTGRLRTAVARVLALAPDRPEGYALKSMLMRQLKRPADALSAINTAISIHGQDPDLWVMRGLIQGEMGQQAEARASLLNAQRIDPGNRNAQTLIAMDSAVSAPWVRATAGASAQQTP